MLKKHVLIPFDKYEKLMKQNENMTKEIKTDSNDGQCVSHTQHIEVSRDKQTDYGLDINKEAEEEPTSASFDIGLQKGKGDNFEFSAAGGINNSPPEPPQGRLPFGRQRGPPGRRAAPKKKKKNKKKNWETF